MRELKGSYSNSKIIKVNLYVPSIESPNFYAVNIRTQEIVANDYTIESLIEKCKKNKR